jgi:hypothetical protein
LRNKGSLARPGIGKWHRRLVKAVMSDVGQLETSDIPHAISVVRLIADIFLFYEKDKLFAGE